ncbi:hypothetical protein IG631_01418 [Alternaria alternata]|nr:hypothetical protein IG631_01418 [Alternaria alternata]
MIIIGHGEVLSGIAFVKSRDVPPIAAPLAKLRPVELLAGSLHQRKSLETYQGTRSMSKSYGDVSCFPTGGINHSGLAFIFSTLGQMRYCTCISYDSAPRERWTYPHQFGQKPCGRQSNRKRRRRKQLIYCSGTPCRDWLRILRIQETQ